MAEMSVDKTADEDTAGGSVAARFNTPIDSSMRVAIAVASNAVFRSGGFPEVDPERLSVQSVKQALALQLDAGGVVDLGPFNTIGTMVSKTRPDTYETYTIVFVSGVEGRFIVRPSNGHGTNLLIEYERFPESLEQ